MKKGNTELDSVQTMAVRDGSHAPGGTTSGSGGAGVLDTGGTNHLEAEMATDKSGPAPSRPTFDAEREIGELKGRVEILTSAVQNIDSMSNTALSQILAVAKLALAFMEQPRAYEHPNLLADAFEQIWSTAEACQNYQDAEVRYVDLKPANDERGDKRTIAFMRHQGLAPL